MRAHLLTSIDTFTIISWAQEATVANALNIILANTYR